MYERCDLLINVQLELSGGPDAVSFRVNLDEGGVVVRQVGGEAITISEALSLAGGVVVLGKLRLNGRLGRFLGLLSGSLSIVVLGVLGFKIGTSGILLTLLDGLVLLSSGISSLLLLFLLSFLGGLLVKLLLDLLLALLGDGVRLTFGLRVDLISNDLGGIFNLGLLSGLLGLKVSHGLLEVLDLGLLLNVLLLLSDLFFLILNNLGLQVTESGLALGKLGLSLLNVLTGTSLDLLLEGLVGDLLLGGLLGALVGLSLVSELVNGFLGLGLLLLLSFGSNGLAFGLIKLLLDLSLLLLQLDDLGVLLGLNEVLRMAVVVLAQRNGGNLIDGDAEEGSDCEILSEVHNYYN